MQLISESVVEETWAEVARFSPKRAARAMSRTAKKQRHLLGFVAAYTEDLSQDAIELGYYMFFNILRMFEKSAPRTMRKIQSSQIERSLDQNEDLLGRLEGAHAKFVERVAQVESSRQPWVMKYLVDTLVEAPDGEDPVSLSEEETGALFLVLKTVIDVLDHSIETA